MSNKPLDKHVLALQELIIYGFERTKLTSMIYELSKSKGEGLGYHQKPYNPRTKILMKSSNPSSSSTAKKRLNAYFVPIAENGKVLNQSEPVIDNSQVLKKSEPQTQRPKVLRKLELKTRKS